MAKSSRVLNQAILKVVDNQIRGPYPSRYERDL